MSIFAVTYTYGAPEEQLATLRVEHRAEHVRNVRQRDELVRRRNHRRHRVQVDAVILCQRDHVDRGTDALGRDLPRHDVAVVLQLRKQDAVARLQLTHDPGMRDGGDQPRRAADEHDLIGLAADEGSDAITRGLVGERHVGAALVHAAVDGGVGLAVAARDRVDDRLWLLRRGGGVEIGPAVRDRREIGDGVERPLMRDRDHADTCRTMP